MNEAGPDVLIIHVFRFCLFGLIHTFDFWIALTRAKEEKPAIFSAW